MIDMRTPASPVPLDAMFIPSVVRQHVDDAAFLSTTRSGVTRAANIKLPDLGRFDHRLEAQLDGLRVAAQHAWPLCDAALETPSAGAVFTVAVRTIEERTEERLERLFALAGAVPEARRGLISAFGWLDPEHLQGIVASLLGSPDAFRRLIGIGACATHRVDPGLVSARRILDTDPRTRARALRTAGEIGCEESAPACAAALRDDDAECRFWAAWSSVLLGNRGVALEKLTETALTAGPHRPLAFGLVLQAMSPAAAHRFLKGLAAAPRDLRALIQGTGIAGDPTYVPWLINHMRDDKIARLAGETFSLITGADLEKMRLDGMRPENFESGPNDDPDDPNVDMDPDEGLAWPDPGKIETWWTANASRFQIGFRYFMGAPVTREHCIDVLKNGYQRQRIVAAHYLCLLEPGTPLFNTSAPAWRQQRLLAKMA